MHIRGSPPSPPPTCDLRSRLAVTLDDAASTHLVGHAARVQTRLSSRADNRKRPPHVHTHMQDRRTRPKAVAGRFFAMLTKVRPPLV
ncbi:uncharacterized protein TRAVEDRAFT_41121 [Trametes versicolor FP-101664 SS1]|uniref:uncharacterized protein n=1 Tax=Trametes versicolor (strain FP-101664) TaxID=717944 RepID=UPI00046237F0|nr:uncharacterized protein TRAVEDRAFT_41121 [Trametes versicolor FP-101664 SS1]EIW63692.1 hypothetical protein TRAVEDRAFT_41121 [Trametes versicolor FP-101664 SS1]